MDSLRHLKNRRGTTIMPSEQRSGKLQVAYRLTF